MSPRQQLVSVPFAAHSQSAFQLSAPGGGPVDAVVVDAAGQVGVGKPNPESMFDVAGTTRSTSLEATEAVSLIRSGTSQAISLLTNTGLGSWNPLTQEGDHLLMWRGGAVNNPGAGLVVAPWKDNPGGIRIDSSGNVGIGVVSPGAKLQVDGPAIINDQPIQARPILYISFANKRDQLWNIPSNSGLAPVIATAVDGSGEWVNPREFGYTEGRLVGRVYITNNATASIQISNYPELFAEGSPAPNGDFSFDTGWVTLTSNSSVGGLLYWCNDANAGFQNREISVAFR